MEPDEVEAADVLEALRVGRVKTQADVSPEVVNPQFPAYVAAGPAPLHRVEHAAGPVELEQVLDEQPGAVPPVSCVSVVSPAGGAVNRGEPGDGASALGYRRQGDRPRNVGRVRPFHLNAVSCLWLLSCLEFGRHGLNHPLCRAAPCLSGPVPGVIHQSCVRSFLRMAGESASAAKPASDKSSQLLSLPLVVLLRLVVALVVGVVVMVHALDTDGVPAVRVSGLQA